jgi:effector-binding domain-containing protein
VLEEPRIVETVAQPAAVIRYKIPRERIREAMDEAFRELPEALRAQGVDPAGPPFSHHFKMDPGTFDFETGFPVSQPIEPSGRMENGELPARTVARTVYHGDFSGLGDAWGEFDEWVATQGHAPAEELWEVYLVGPETSPKPEDWRTELDRPLVRVAGR